MPSCSISGDRHGLPLMQRAIVTAAASMSPLCSTALPTAEDRTRAAAAVMLTEALGTGTADLVRTSGQE